MKAPQISRWRMWADLITLLPSVKAVVLSDGKGRVSTQPRPTFPAGVCRDCGCTHRDPCVDVLGECCSWTDKTKTRCTFCRGGVRRVRGRR